MLRSEIQFWVDQLEEVNGQDIWHSPSAIRLVYSDASNTGYGGYIIEHDCHVTQGQWLPQEASQSSTWRELKAVHNVLKSLANKLLNHRVCWFTDNLEPWPKAIDIEIILPANVLLLVVVTL